MDDFFVKPERKQIRELNLVPVIDMFTTVIFFLILSTSFFAFTKLTVPPAKVSVNTDPLTPPPMATKLVLGPASEGGVRLLLSWVGEAPGQETRTVENAKVESEVRGLVEAFKKRFPKERTVQLGMGPSLSYQVLIHAMDGAREQLPDLVLISPDEAAARLSGKAEGESK
jgi:biopolymer transport protein ExbD